jgi:hypothetical protein
MNWGNLSFGQIPVQQKMKTKQWKKKKIHIKENNRYR